MTAVDELKRLQVDVIRISPQSDNTRQVVRAFRDVVDGKTDAKTAMDALPPPPGVDVIEDDGDSGARWCNGFWYGVPGMDDVREPS